MRNTVFLHVHDYSRAGKPEGTKEIALWPFDERLLNLRWVPDPAYCHERREYQKEDHVENEDDGSNGVQPIETLRARIEERCDTPSALRAGKK